MQGLSQGWITSITIIIAALPTIGTLLRQYGQAKNRKLDGREIAALYLTLWGFLLLVSLAEGLGMPTVRWYLGWGLPIIVGLIFTGISLYLICRDIKKQREV